MPIIRERGDPGAWDAWLDAQGLDAGPLPAGPEFSDAALCLDAAIAGQGVFMAWETLAGDALANGSLVEPFTHRAATGPAYWSVTGRLGAKTDAMRALEDWMARELSLPA